MLEFDKDRDPETGFVGYEIGGTIYQYDNGTYVGLTDDGTAVNSGDRSYDSVRDALYIESLFFLYKVIIETNSDEHVILIAQTLNGDYIAFNGLTSDPEEIIGDLRQIAYYDKNELKKDLVYYFNKNVGV